MKMAVMKHHWRCIILHIAEGEDEKADDNTTAASASPRNKLPLVQIFILDKTRAARDSNKEDHHQWHFIDTPSHTNTHTHTRAHKHTHTHTHTHTRARTPSIFGWTWQSFDSKAWDPLLAQGFQIPGKRHFIKIMVTIMWWWGWWLWGRLTVIQDGMLLAKGHACAMTSHPRLLHACALCPFIITTLYYLPLHIVFCYFAFESF